MKERGIAFLAWLWRFMWAIWTLVIIGALVGTLGNIIPTLLTTGSITFTGLHSLTSWLSTNLAWIIIVFLAVLALTIGAYLAHRHQAREQQKQQLAQNEQTIKAGVSAALEEHQTKHSNKLEVSPQDTSIPASAWNVPYLRNPFFTGREELLEQLHDNLTSLP